MLNELQISIQRNYIGSAGFSVLCLDNIHSWEFSDLKWPFITYITGETYTVGGRLATSRHALWISCTRKKLYTVNDKIVRGELELPRFASGPNFRFNLIRDGLNARRNNLSRLVASLGRWLTPAIAVM